MAVLTGEERAEVGSRGGVVPRGAVVARPRTRRPAGERPLTRRPVATGPRHVAPSACVVRPAARPVRFLVLVALAAAVATLLLGMLAAAGGVAGAADVPSRTSVTQVRAGESVWDVAQRAAPAADQEAVVDRIIALNPSAGKALRAGQPLVVPAAPVQRR